MVQEQTWWRETLCMVPTGAGHQGEQGDKVWAKTTTGFGVSAQFLRFAVGVDIAIVLARVLYFDDFRLE